MSKAKNRKRAKMMHVKKKEREALKLARSKGETAIEKRLKNSDRPKEVIRDGKKPDIKVSELVLKFIEPLMDQAIGFEEQKGIVGLGVMAWNLGTIQTCKGNEAMLKSLDAFNSAIPEGFIEELLKYADIKSQMYPSYNYIIHDYEFQSVDRKNNHLTVAYETIDMK